MQVQACEVTKAPVGWSQTQCQGSVAALDPCEAFLFELQEGWRIDPRTGKSLEDIQIVASPGGDCCQYVNDARYDIWFNLQTGAQVDGKTLRELPHPQWRLEIRRGSRRWVVIRVVDGARYDFLTGQAITGREPTVIIPPSSNDFSG